MQHIGIVRGISSPNLHPALSKVSFPPHQIIIFMQSSKTSFICRCGHCCCIIFLLTSYLMYTYVTPILINRCSLNVAFSVTKVQMVKIHPSKMSIPTIFQCYFHSNHLKTLFRTPFFISNFIKFHLNPLDLWFHGLSCELIKCNGYQISTNKPNETPHLMLYIDYNS